jgi:putative PIN family toxin of toxin-antitoxin system
VRVALLDTNVWVSAFLNPHGAPAQLRQAWQAGEFRVIIALPLLEELAEVLSRPRLTRKYSIDPGEVQTFLRLLSDRGQMVFPAGDLQLCRDPDDDLVLEAALLGQAEFVVTRDDDLKADADLVAALLARGVRVVTVQTFLNELAVEQ